MLCDYTYSSTDIHLTHIRAMLMTSGDFAEYCFRQFPFELNDLTDIKILYPSLVMEISHMRMPLKTTPSRCVVLNALIAYWPAQRDETQVAVVEFRSIQKAYCVEPNIAQCKRILLKLISDKWGVTFKGKELIVC